MATSTLTLILIYDSTMTLTVSFCMLITLPIIFSILNYNDDPYYYHAYDCDFHFGDWLA